MLGPSGPRRLRLAVEHLCQYRGGICFCIDLDPRWVVKLIKKGWMEHLEAYKKHCIDQALTILSAGHDIKCMFTTPKLLESLCKALEKQGKSFKDTGITGIFSGGTEFTPQFTRFCVEEYLRRTAGRKRHLHDADLRQHADGTGLQQAGFGGRRLQDQLLRPAAAGRDRSRRFRRSHKVVGYGETGRVKLTR